MFICMAASSLRLKQFGHFQTFATSRRAGTRKQVLAPSGLKLPHRPTVTIVSLAFVNQTRHGCLASSSLVFLVLYILFLLHITAVSIVVVDSTSSCSIPEACSSSSPRIPTHPQRVQVRPSSRHHRVRVACRSYRNHLLLRSRVMRCSGAVSPALCC